MQGAGRPGLNLLGGAVALADIDARSLVLALAICGGAATYFALPFEPAVETVPGAVVGTFLLWLAALPWSTSDTAITLALIFAETGQALVEG